jgi:tyrosyl-tRNA synthetase
MKKPTQLEKISEILERGTEKIYPSPAFLKKQLMGKRKLKIYAGFDPTGSSLHLGHLAVLNKLAQLQELGHQIFFLIGNFTALIGDPSGRSTTRPQLTKEEVLTNSDRFYEQAKNVLSFKKPNPARIVFNNQWLNQLKTEDIIRLASHFTVQQLLIRDMFQKRIEKKRPIFVHEFLYPLFQAYDSVALEADLEVGGNDQTFNMLCGRSLVKDIQHREKMVLTLKLLTDAQGKKFSKTEKKAIFLDDSPEEMYGKVMAFPDQSVEPALLLITRIPLKEIEKVKKAMEGERVNRRDAKARLAFEMVSQIWGKKEAERAAREFESVFQKKGLPADIPQIQLPKKTFSLVDLLIKTNLASSKSEARRLISQKGIKINQKTETNVEAEIKLKKGTLIQRGKRKIIQIQ